MEDETIVNEETTEPTELQQALESANALNEQLSETPDDSIELAARVADLEEENGRLRDDYNALREDFGRVTGLLDQLNGTFSVLQSLVLANQQNIAILGNEPIVRRRVGQPQGVQLEAATYHTAPVPPKSLLKQGNGRVQDAVAADLERQALRRQEMGVK